MAVASSSFQPSRIGFGSISGAPRAGRADREVQACGAAGVGPADAAEHRAADHVRALAQAAQAHLRGVEPERPREVGVEGLEAGLLAQLGVGDLLEAAGVARARAVRDARTGAPSPAARRPSPESRAGSRRSRPSGLGLAARRGRRARRRVLELVRGDGAGVATRGPGRSSARGRSSTPIRGARRCSGCRTRPGARRSCPSLRLSPTFLISPSFTATTGAPRRVKMPMLRRPSLDSTRLAAFSPAFACFRS